MKIRRRREALIAHPEAWVRVVFLSGMAVRLTEDPARMERLAIEASALNADVVLFGGGFVRAESEAVTQLAPLASIRAKIGKYFVLGATDYHDDPVRVRDDLCARGMRDLTNGSVTIMTHGRAFRLTGVDDAESGAPSAVAQVSSPFPHVVFSARAENIVGAESAFILTSFPFAFLEFGI